MVFVCVFDTFGTLYSHLNHCQVFSRTFQKIARRGMLFNFMSFFTMVEELENSRVHC